MATQEESSVTILNDLSDEIMHRIGALQVAEQFSLRTLFGGTEKFAEYGTSGQRKALGTQFRKAVAAGEIYGVEYSHHAESPAEHWYRRIWRNSVYIIKILSVEQKEFSDHVGRRLFHFD